MALDAYRTQYAKYRLGEAEGAKGEKPTEQVVVVANNSGGFLQESEAQVRKGQGKGTHRAGGREGHPRVCVVSTTEYARLYHRSHYNAPR